MRSSTVSLPRISTQVDRPASLEAPLHESGDYLIQDANRYGFHVNRREFESCPMGRRSGMGVRAHPTSTSGGEILSEFAPANSQAAPSGAAQGTSPVERTEGPSEWTFLARTQPALG
jgi:hypothetical protein